jgi:hypothetical protein
MGHGRRKNWASVLAGALSLAGCSNSNEMCGKPACPTATFSLRALDDSSVTWTFSGASSQTATGFVTGQPSDGQCSFRYHQGHVFPARGDGGVDSVAPGYFSIDCRGGEWKDFDLLGWGFGDLRDWPTGTTTRTASRRDYGSDCLSCPPAAETTGNPCTVVDFEDLQVTVVVEAATGSAAPYPKLVTDDFVRTFRVEFDTSTATPLTSTGQACDYPVTLHVSLHFTQTAADYVYDPQAVCVCE